MALPQGINFRATLAFVTDGANEDMENNLGGANESYPRVTAQGNTVGWEEVTTIYETRDRNSGNDRRLAGMNFNAGAADFNFRIDLPSAGNYRVGIAAGDASYAQIVTYDLYDTSSSLGSLTTGSTSGANQFKDATNTEYSAANWVTSQTLVAKTFSTTILRLRKLAAGSNVVPVAHFYVEAADVVAPTGVYLAPTQSNLRWR